MLFADSMSLLWFSYYGLSLLVLLAVYFGLAFLPRLPRLIVTWGVAGAMWMPASYRLPLVEEDRPASVAHIVAALVGRERRERRRPWPLLRPRLPPRPLHQESGQWWFCSVL